MIKNVHLTCIEADGALTCIGADEALTCIGADEAGTDRVIGWRHTIKRSIYVLVKMHYF